MNATPAGLPGKGHLPSIAFRPGQVVVDFVYGATEFTREARGAGATVLPGEALLVRQGALAFTLWMQRPAPEALMKQALEAAQEKLRR